MIKNFLKKYNNNFIFAQNGVVRKLNNNSIFSNKKNFKDFLKIQTNKYFIYNFEKKNQKNFFKKFLIYFEGNLKSSIFFSSCKKTYLFGKTSFHSLYFFFLIFYFYQLLKM